MKNHVMAGGDFSFAAPSTPRKPYD